MVDITNLDIDDAMAVLFDPACDPVEFAAANGFPVVRIVHIWGHGEWHILEEESRLLAICNYLDDRYPGGRHRLEYREINTPLKEEENG